MLEFPPVPYQGGPPALLLGKKVKRSFFKRFESYSLKDFVTVEHNKMVTYHIIPHADVSNNTKRLWRAIYKMYEMYEGTGSRLGRDGLKFHYREKDYFWFDVIFKQQDGQKKIEFYVSTSEYQAQKLKRKLENKMSVTIKDASIDDIHVPLENTVVQEMRLLKHDIFSLNTNSNDTKTPIANVMNIVDELINDGDMCRISVCNEAENRNRWVKNAAWAFEKLSKGKAPQRANVSGKRIIGGAKVGLAGFINEVNSLITDVFQAFENSFFKSDKVFKKEKVISKVHTVADEVGTSRISHEKGNQPVFKTRMRIAAHSSDQLTRETMAETAALSYADLTETNELHGIKIKIGHRRTEILNELNTLALSKKTRFDPNVNLISTDEMSKLALQMPVKELQRKYADALSVKKKVEIEIPAIMRDDTGIFLGHAELKDEKIPVYFPVKNPDELYRGYVFIGGQGNGKDTAIKNWIVDACLDHGISAIIPEVIVEEGERGMADGIRDALPSDKVIDIDLSDENYIVPMDLTEVILKLGKKGASRFADEVIDFFGDMEGMARTKRYLKSAAKASGGSLYNIKRIIEDEEYRVSIIEKLLQEGNKRLATELLNWGDNSELGSKADPVLNRLDDFFGNDTLFDIFSQDPKQEVDFAKWMKEGKVVIIRIPNRKLGELASRTLVHWVTLRTFMIRMLMSKEEQKNGCFMVFNEPEQYATEGLTKLMGRIGTEGRKERFGALYAFHHWNKLPMSLQENLQGGGVQQFLFANDHIKTFELSKHRLEPTITIEDASKLPRFHAIVSVRAGGDLQHAFICKMKPPVEKKYDNSELTKIHTKQCGRSWEQLQNECM
ncbi:ATP-binding protein [Bacillus pseudomycoides]|uniref:ATP-binding protein n=2 Tax=Bacillus pseudomycoides TaxID=64104 RepID=UPI000BF71CDB|nr:ATP-binding protein [Bacillus pseudomycoides]PFW93905.1 ATP-binding protein [Bacillus pseudomycoides]PGC41219.1 ATP-binding protein [Bacillus pseudomycoides]